MKITLLKILRHEARSWWYHRQLRSQGLTQKASLLERRRILEAAESLREARQHGGMFLGQGSFQLLWGPFSVGGYGDLYQGLPLAAWVAGVPVVDLADLGRGVKDFALSLSPQERIPFFAQCGAKIINYPDRTPVNLPRAKLVVRCLEYSGQFEKVLMTGHQAIALDRYCGRWRSYSLDLDPSEHRIFWAEAPHGIACSLFKEAA